MAQLEYIYQSESPYEYQYSHEAFLDPLETQIQEQDVYILSANATFIEPPTKHEGYAIVWDRVTEQWEEVEDHRSMKYWLPGELYGSIGHIMSELGSLPEGASTTEPEESRDQRLAKLLPAVEQALNAFAATRNYDSIISACSYSNSTNAQYKLEAEYCITLRDNTWAAAYAAYEALQADETLDVPTPEEFIQTLPVATAKWPE